MIITSGQIIEETFLMILSYTAKSEGYYFLSKVNVLP